MINRTTPLSISCCSASVAEFDQAVRQIFNASEGEHWRFWQEMPGGFCRNNIRPLPGAQKLNYAIWSPANRTSGSVFISNRQDGGDTIIYNISRTFLLEVIKIYISEKEAKYPYFNFQYFRKGKETRRVYAMLDGTKWVFFASGEPLSFEDVDSYQNKPANDRLNESVITSYLKALGWNLADEAFWHSETAIYRGRQL